MTRHRWFLRRKLWWIVGAAAVLVVCVGILLRQPRDFYYSGRRISVSVGSSARFANEGMVLRREGARETRAKAAAAVPYLRKDLTSEKTGVVVVAAMTLGAIGEPAKPAAPELLALLKSSQDAHVRLRVAEAVWRLDRNTNMVAPVMIAELANWSRQTNALHSQTVDSYGESRQQVAARVLGEIGPAAREAIPFLQVMSQSSFDAQRIAAATALKSVMAQ